MQDLLFKFKSAEDSQKVDLMRVGPIAGANDDRTLVKVEPDFEEEGTPLEMYQQGVWAGLAACGVFPDIEQSE